MTEKQKPINPYETLDLIAKMHISEEEWKDRVLEVRTRYLRYMQERFPDPQYLVELCQTGLAQRIARWFNDCMEYLHLNHFSDWKGIRVIARIDADFRIREQELEKLDAENGEHPRGCTYPSVFSSQRTNA